MRFKGSDRRGRNRYRARIPFTLRGTGEPVRGITRNISLLGISAYGEKSIDQVKPVECVIELPGQNQQVLAYGTVTRCAAMSEPGPDGAYELGVFFKEFDAAGEQVLTHYLESVSQKEQAEIAVAYKELKKKLAARKRKKAAALRKKKKRRHERLKKKRARLAKERRKKLLAAQGKTRVGRPPGSRNKKKKTAKTQTASKK